jgi:hypothetical protein
MSSSNWYIHLKGTVLGPMPTDELLRMLGQSRVQLLDYGWRHGLKKWTRLSDLQEFKDLVPEAPKIPTPKEKELRKSLRCTVDGEIGTSKNGEGELLELDQKEALVKWDQKLSVGDEIKMTIHVPDMHMTLNMTALIVEETKPKVYRLEFVRMNPAHYRAISQYLIDRILLE